MMFSMFPCLNQSMIVKFFYRWCQLKDSRAYIHALPGVLLAIFVNDWEDNLHASRALRPEDIRLIHDSPMLLPHILKILCVFGILSIIKEHKLRSEEVRPSLSEIAFGILLHLLLVDSDHVVGGRVGASLLPVQQEFLAVREVHRIFWPESI